MEIYPSKPTACISTQCMRKVINKPNEPLDNGYEFARRMLVERSDERYGIMRDPGYHLDSLQAMWFNDGPLHAAAVSSEERRDYYDAMNSPLF